VTSEASKCESKFLADVPPEIREVLDWYAAGAARADGFGRSGSRWPHGLSRGHSDAVKIHSAKRQQQHKRRCALVPELRHAHGAQWKLLQVCQLREHKRLLWRGRGTGWMFRNGSTNVLTCSCIVSTYVLTYCRKEKKHGKDEDWSAAGQKGTY
jgi:hypothetical protein